MAAAVNVCAEEAVAFVELAVAEVEAAVASVEPAFADVERAVEGVGVSDTDVEEPAEVVAIDGVEEVGSLVATAVLGERTCLSLSVRT